ncbi:MAG: PAAR domain-containing protein [Geminicoccaceae bacterium]
MPPAARLSDMHECPMENPAPVPVPHVGGPIIGPGMPNVLIENMPASVLGDMAFCVGPPDAIVEGSATVMIGGRPAARMGDATAHGGSVIAGAATVMIGD